VLWLVLNRASNCQAQAGMHASCRAAHVRVALLRVCYQIEADMQLCLP
jgi:hypothetical protein